MENWEKELREKLDKEIEDGWYTIEIGKFTVGTSKRGNIDFLVEVERKLRGEIEPAGEVYRCNKNEVLNYAGKYETMEPLTAEKLKKVIEDVFYKIEK